ncbi:MAG: hypothetical protein HY674_14205 [Chloroflexi bacterium]|nr:hypothetical protein [Chloroflexota bacterium]
MTARISSPSLGAAAYQEAGTWTAAVSHRWQYSDRHFIGEDEQRHRELEGSEVKNNIHLVDLSLGYAITKRFAATLSVPFQFATRSTAVRDANAPRNQFGNRPVIDRFSTSASGLSDVKLLGTAWVLDSDRHPKENVSVGLGVLFPTGEKDAKDIFKVFATNAAGVYQPRAETRNVDNSIQPGAGAWGIIFDVYAFKQAITNLNLFVAGTYIAMPEKDAGVYDGAGGNTGNIWSVGDSYLFRAGLGYTFWPKQGLTLTLGGRMEGTPSTDLFGESGGRRRPGLAASIEPGLLFAKNRWSASFSVPVAVYRNRERNFVGAEGDAAFADYMTLLSVGRSF